MNDVGLLLEQVAALRVGDAARTRELRHRYLALLLDGARATESALPGRPPSWEEIAARWNP